MGSPASIERVPLTELDGHDLSRVAWSLYLSTTDHSTRNQLWARHLIGVLERHSDPAISVNSLERARKKMAAGEMAASALMHNGKCVGMDSEISGLPLRRPTCTPTGLLRAKWTRRSGLLARDVNMQGPNITAWLDAEHMSVDNLAPVYAALAESGGEGSWTLESGDRGDVAVESVLEAGLRFWMLPARYDDHEASGVPPVSTLYAYMPNAGVEGDR